MPKRKFKRYTVAEKLAYHTRRKDDKSFSEVQRSSSRHWVEGYNDKFYDTNLFAMKAELDYRKSYKNANNQYYVNNILKPCIRGMEARAKAEKSKK